MGRFRKGGGPEQERQVADAKAAAGAGQKRLHVSHQQEARMTHRIHALQDKLHWHVF